MLQFRGPRRAAARAFAQGISGAFEDLLFTSCSTNPWPAFKADLETFLATNRAADPQAQSEAAVYARTQAHYVAGVVERFREITPQARVLEVHRSDHYVFRSNEQEMLDAIEEFVARR